jgi:septation ring formation regulator EzrA
MTGETTISGMDVIDESFVDFQRQIRQGNYLRKVQAINERKRMIRQIGSMRKDIKILQAEIMKPLPKPKPYDKNAYAEYVTRLKNNILEVKL